MADVYKYIATLCKEKGISGAKMCLDLGMSKSFMTELKKGRAKSIKIETASKIADYFGVPIDYLLGLSLQEKPILEKEDGQNSLSTEAALDEELISYLVQLTPEEQAKVGAFVCGLLAARGAGTFRQVSGN